MKSLLSLQAWGKKETFFISVKSLINKYEMRKFLTMFEKNLTLVTMAFILLLTICGLVGAQGNVFSTEKFNSSSNLAYLGESLHENSEDDVHITITDFGIEPDHITVSPGQGIHWTNEASQPHTITAHEELFESGELPPGSGFSIALPVPGAHGYSSIHDETFSGLIQVTLPEIRGPPADPVSDHIPNILFPPVDDRDISVHPDLTAYASRTRIMVGFANDATVEEANSALQEAGVDILGGLPELSMVLAKAPDSEDFSALDEALSVLRDNAAVRYAAMSMGVESQVITPRAESALEEEMQWQWNFSPRGGNWGLEEAKFPQAWNLMETIQREGNTEIITGIIDKGFEEHRDLSNLEIITEIEPGDSDRTIKVPNKADFHGNHVAGIIGADFDNMWEDENWEEEGKEEEERGRSIGISGANPFARMQGYSLEGYGNLGFPWSTYTLSDKSLELFTHVLENAPEEMKAINYSIRAAKFHLNNDLVPARWLKRHPGQTPNDQEDWLEEFAEIGRFAADVATIAAEQDIMIVQSAGNDGTRFCPDRTEEGLLLARNTSEFAWASHHWGTDQLPDTESLHNPIIVVEAIQQNGHRWFNSNIGGDIAAPGSNILSTTSSDVTERSWYEDEGRAVKTDSGYYCTLSGTSMAAPLVTATIGYMLAYDDELTIEDIRSALLTWAEPPEEDQSVETAPRLNAFTSLLSLEGAARDLVDVNDMSQDGNRRLIRQLDQEGNLIDPPETDTGFSPEEGFFTDPDGHVDIRDLRRFRDAWLQACIALPSMTGAPEEGDIYLDGDDDHPKKDLNFDGCVYVEGDPGGCLIPEFVNPRFDFNARRVTSPDEDYQQLVPLTEDGSPASNLAEAVEMSDLELLFSQWSPDPENPDNKGLVSMNENGELGLQDLYERVYSADLEIHAAALFEEDLDRVHVSVTHIDEGRKVFKSVINDPEDFRIATVPLEQGDPQSTAFQVRAWGSKGGRKVEALPLELSGLKFGEDRRVDMGTRLVVDISPHKLEADGTSSAFITASLVTGPGDEGEYEVEGLPVHFEITPEGEGHAYLEHEEAETDDRGTATNWFHAGTVPEVYTVTVTIAPDEEQEISTEATASTQAELQIHYIWQQTNLEFWREGTTRWPDEVTPETPDASSAELEDEVYWCVDSSRLELDPDQGESSLLRQGMLYGWGNELYLDEEVSGDPVHFKHTWEISRPDGSEDDSGEWHIAWEPQEHTQYTEHALPEKVSAEITAEGIILSGLHELSFIDYLHDTTFTGEEPPVISSVPGANLNSGNRWGIYSQRFTDPFEDGAGTFFQHGSGFSEPITFELRDDGTYEPYKLCFTLEQDISRPAPLYTGREIIGYCEASGERKPVVAPSHYYEPGQAPLPAGDGKVRLNFALTMVATLDGEEVELELPDCEEHEPPEADFEYEPKEPAEGKLISFLDDSRWEQHAIVSWDWDFGDGEESTMRSPVHRYRQSGTYQVALTVTDSKGFTDTISKEVVVENLPPAAEIDDVTVLEGEQIPIRFTVSDPGPEDSENLQVQLQADTPELAPYEDTVEAGTIDLLYEGTVSPGEYNLTLTVTDQDEASIVESGILTVIASEDAELTAGFSYQPSDPEVQELVFFRDHSFGVQDIEAWHWDFGDGQGSSEQEPSHRFAEAAAYPVTLTVTDTDGQTDSLTRTVTVGEPAGPDPVIYSCGSLDPVECEFLHLLNAYRIENNLPIVEYSSTLTAASRRHSEDMAEHEFWEHVGSDGSTPRERIIEAGYPEETVTGENVAVAVTSDAEAVFYQWKTSPGHHENMLRPQWRAVGLARIQGEDGRWYWTNKFGDLLDAPAGENCNQENHQANQNSELESTGMDTLFKTQLTAFNYELMSSSVKNTAAATKSIINKVLVYSQTEDEEYPPVPALVVYPASPGPGSQVTFVNRSRDTGGEPIAAILNPGEGLAEVSLEAGEVFEQTYTGEEDVRVSLTAVDAEGASLEVSRLLQFRDLIPSSLTYYGPESGIAGEMVYLEALLKVKGTEPWQGGIGEAPVTFTLDDLSVTGTTNPVQYGHTFVYVSMELEDIEPGIYDLEISFPGCQDYASTSTVVPFRVWPHQPPMANAAGPYGGHVDNPVFFDASGSREGDFPIATYEWDVNNDGSFEAITEEPIFEYAYSAVYDGKARLRVTDTEGIYREDTTRVIVVEGEPSSGFTSRVNLSSDSVEADDYSISPSLSADGRYVAFTSAATNLVEGADSGREQVYVRDRKNGETVLISHNAEGEAGANHSWNPSISGDGRYIAFQSYARNLVPEFTTASRRHIFVYDRDANETGVFDQVQEEGGVAVELVSVAPGGTQGDDFSQKPVISADGRYVTFESYAANLTSEDTGGRKQVYRRDLQEGQTEMVSVSSAGVPAEYSCANRASMSPDGRYVAFRSRANNLTEEDTDWNSSIYLRDMVEGDTTLVSISSAGEPGYGYSEYPSISADGRYVAFQSTAENLADLELERRTDYIYVHDRNTAETVIIAPEDMTGEISSYDRSLPSISADGRYVAFLSGDPLLAAGKDSSRNDLFLYDRDANETGAYDEPGGTQVTLESVCSTGQAGNDRVVDWECWYRSTPAFCEEARFIAFASNATNLAPGINNNTTNVFIRDRAPEAEVITQLNYTGPLAWVEGGKVTLEACLSDMETGQGLEGMVVSYTLGSLTEEVSTEEDGAAAVTFDLSLLDPGTYSLVVEFVGDLTHSPALDTHDFVVAENNAPVAKAGDFYRVFDGEDLFLDGSASFDDDPGDQVVSWDWDLTGNGDFNDATGKTISLGWEEVEELICGGTADETHVYNIALQVTDTMGEVGIDSADVEVIVDFALEVLPEAQPVSPGGSNAFAVSLLAVEDFQEEVSLKVQDLPKGLSAEISDQTIVPGDVSVLTISAEPDAPTDIFEIVVEGTSVGKIRSTTAAIRVAYGLIPKAYGDIAGQITDEETGEPLAEVRVKIGTKTLTTDSEGKFHREEVPLGHNNAPRNYTVSIDHNGYWPIHETVTAISGVVSQVDLPLIKERTGSVEGQVMVGLIEEDEPVPTEEALSEASVTIISPPGDQINVDSQGNYLLSDLELRHNNTPRTYRIQAEAEGYWPQEKTVSVEADDTKTLDFELVEKCYTELVGGSISVELQDGSTIPVEGALLALVPRNRVPGWHTDPHSDITINDPEDFFSLFPGAQTGVSGQDGALDFNFPVELTLGYNNFPPGRYAFYVAFPPESGEGPPWEFTHGYWVFHTHQCGEEIEVHFTVPYKEPPEPEPETSGGLYGWIYDEETKEPIKDALVEVSGNSKRTDEEGYYEIKEINLGGKPSKKHTVTVRADGYWTEREEVKLIHEVNTNLDISILYERFAEIEGTVKDVISGDPLEGVNIYRGYNRIATSNENGKFQISNLSVNPGNQPLTFNMRAEKAGYWPQHESTIIRAEETSQVEIQLMEICEGATISGLVVNAFTLEPIEGAVISADSKSITTCKDGNFQLVDIDVGYNNNPRSVLVRAEAEGFHTQSKVVTVFCGANIFVDFGRVETETGIITGTVTSSNGRPLPEVFIGSGFGGSDVTSADGNYRLEKVPLGEEGADRDWEITAIPPRLCIETQSNIVTAKAGREVQNNFEFDIASWELEIEISGAGEVSLEPERNFYYDGEKVKLEAFSDEDAFSHWEGDITDEPEEEKSLTLRMDQDRTVTAVFEQMPVEDPEIYTLEVDSTSGGSVTEPGEDKFEFEEGKTVDLVAEAEEGYQFIEWSGDVDSIEDIASTQTLITIEDNHSITAVFAPIIHTITATADTGGSIEPEGDIEAEHGTDQAFTITPDQGYTISEVLVDEDSEGPISEFIFENISSSHTIHAVFEPLPVFYRLIINMEGQGEIELEPPGEKFAKGTEIILQANPEEGWLFSHWEGDTSDEPEEEKEEKTLTLLMNQDRSVTAIFSKEDDDEDIDQRDISDVFIRPDPPLFSPEISDLPIEEVIEPPEDPAIDPEEPVEEESVEQVTEAEKPERIEDPEDEIKWGTIFLLVFIALLLIGGIIWVLFSRQNHIRIIDDKTEEVLETQRIKAKPRTQIELTDALEKTSDNSVRVQFLKPIVNKLFGYHILFLKEDRIIEEIENYQGELEYRISLPQSPQPD